MKKKVQFYTLGCKLNFSESSTLAREFEAEGYRRAKRGETADVYVINTCSVTAEADKKCRNIIRRAHKTNPNATIVVTGCYAQLQPESIANIDGVDIVIGNNNKGDIINKVKKHRNEQIISHCEADGITSFFSAFSSGDRTRAFLKVQDGCSYECTYCTIPQARGTSRNIPIIDLVKQAETIASKGQQEIILTGVNTGDFGRSTGEKFIDLLKALDPIEGINRYRISSIEPNLLSDEVIKFCANSKKFQPHFHIPLQAGSDKILKLMRRRYNTVMFRERIEAVRREIPDAFIGIDVIVGFPGESEQEFQESFNFLSSLKPSFLHVFPYSERPNTPAITFSGKVSTEEKHSRVHRLTELNNELSKKYYEQFIGKEVNILVESAKSKDNKMHGYTEHYVRVELPYQAELVNQIIKKKVTAINHEGFAVTD